jgi:hypothetical protein
VALDHKTYPGESRTIEADQEAMAGDDDQVNMAAMDTLLKRGTSYTVQLEERLEHTPAAAIPCYEVTAAPSL